MKTTTRRPGYAIVLTMIFLVLFLSLWSLAFRQVGSVLRIERARTERHWRDTGVVRVAAQAMAALEQGDLSQSLQDPPRDLVYHVPLSRPANPLSSQPGTDTLQYYLVTFTPPPNDPPSSDPDHAWTVSVTLDTAGQWSMYPALPAQFP